MIARAGQAAACGLLALLVACGRSGEEQSEPVDALVTLDTTRRYQVMTGWEVVDQAGQESARSYAMFRDSLLDAAVTDLGITRVRLWLRSGFENSRDLWAEIRAGQKQDFRCGRFVTVNDNDDPHSINWSGFKFAQLDYTIENLVLPMKRRVEARGEKFFLNANYVAFMKLCPEGTPYIHQAPEEYAEFVLASYLHMRDKYGLIPDAWEVILEPENTYFWRGQQIGAAILATARLLEQHGFTPRFIAPSTTRAANAPRYFQDLIAVPGARAYVEELAYHRYRELSTADIEAIGALGEEYGVKTAMLEHIGSGHQDLHEDLTVGRVSAWQQFALAFPTKDDNGAQYYLIENPDGERPRLKMGHRTYYLRQYFRYIRPGAVRFAAASDVSVVDPVAFENPGSKHVVVIKGSSPARIRIAGLPSGKYSARFTTAAERDVAASIATDDHGRVRVTLPAAGVITVYAH